ncbi:hypothetical protein GCM10010964_03310 [Caldovatus sediminis]|uniref:Uncharacterized protein n=1 Tax=Caldovatus sediminis TaxID=2041189 RepID=A0A8J2Z7U3_9PROT|nr:hypothetical protein [Caldovatus sediminis]GGG18428.1 hypothetical protein GCM10010964_03310 [Caldovatus sediminis]
MPWRRAALARLAVCGTMLAAGGCVQDAAVAPHPAGERPPRMRLAPGTPRDPPPASASRDERAPVPDRDLQAPRGTGTAERPRLSPTLIVPRGTTRGGTFEGDPFQRQQDRLFDQPAPGATLRLPFSY